MSSELELSYEDVTTESDTCVLSVNRTLTHGNPTYYANAIEAQANPLARKILQVEALEAILLQANSVTLLKPVDGEEWTAVQADVKAVVEEHFSGLDDLSNANSADMNLSEEELSKEIQLVLDEEVNPMVKSHGGVISVQAVHGSTLFIHMGGGCQGCAMSTATLKQGVEGVVMGRFPQIEQILDSTDHAAGTNPYFKD